ncbi:hypothetical protein T01_4742, partial [Trichinella spiralis]
MFTSVCSICGISNILGYINCTHFIHDSITLTSSEYDVSSDGTFNTSNVEDEEVRISIQKLLQFIYHCVNYFSENFNFYYSSCCSCVLYVASQTSVIAYINCTHFIHDSITLTSSEYDVSSVGTFKMDYVNIMREFSLSRSRCHSQTAFPTDKNFTMISTCDSNKSSSLSSINCCPAALLEVLLSHITLTSSEYDVSSDGTFS